MSFKLLNTDDFDWNLSHLYDCSCDDEQFKKIQDHDNTLRAALEKAEGENRRLREKLKRMKEDKTELLNDLQKAIGLVNKL